MKIGETVYLRPVEMGNAYRRDKSIKEAVIEKIGRKYVTLSTYYGKFEIESGIQVNGYSPNYRLYTSKEELDKELESEDLIGRIKKSIPNYGKWEIGIEKLRQIAEILNC